MSTSAKERIQVHHRLSSLGLGYSEANQLRRISMTLRNWFELECGHSNGCIERDGKTDKPFWLYSDSMRRVPIPDREKGARTRLAKLMESFPELTYYIQTDPRGAALYILKKSDVNGHDIEQVYTSGIAVY